MTSWRWCGVILRGRPKRTPRALARLRPSPVRARISSRSALFVAVTCDVPVVGSQRAATRGESWNDILKQLQSLCAQFRRKNRQAGDVPSWLRETGNEPRPQHIISGRNDGNRSRCLLRYLRCEIAGSPDDIYVHADKVGSKLRKVLGTFPGIAQFDDDIPAINVALLA
jgi:hypothetical protein